MNTTLRRAIEELPAATAGFSRVCLAFSGGVDSAVAGWLLKQRGFAVHGVYLRSWDAVDEDPGRESCPAQSEMAVAEQLAERLQLDSFTSLDFVRHYWNDVFTNFLRDYTKGLTPNPDLPCNRFVKFGHLYDYAFRRAPDRAAANDLLATGHYARIRQRRPGLSGPRLLRGLDRHKDQSYFLASVPPERLDRVVFPCGLLHKETVVELARKCNLTAQGQVSSRGICFVGKRKSVPDFIRSYAGLPPQPGRVIDVDTGYEVRQHNGEALFWTVGQRARLGGQLERYFVVAKDIELGDVWVCRGGNHPALHVRVVRGHQVSEPLQSELGETPRRVLARLGSREPLQACSARLVDGDTVWLEFDESRRRVSAGQAIVLYDAADAETCLGSALVDTDPLRAANRGPGSQGLGHL